MIARIRGVKAVRAKGKLYYYHRKTMTRLPGKPLSPEFMAKLHELDARGEIAVRSLGWLIQKYKDGTEWRGHAPATRVWQQKVFDRLRPNQTTPLRAIDAKWGYACRDTIAKERTWTFANKAVFLLRYLFGWAMKRDLVDRNPFLAVDPVRRPRGMAEKNRPWTEDELELILATALPWLRLAVAIAAYTGLRESDVVRATWADYDGLRFRALSQKTGIATNTRAHYRLREVLDAAPRVGETIVVSSAGRPVSADTFRTAFFRLIRKIDVEPGLSVHGLRHKLASEIIDLGGSLAEGAAVLGHASERTTAHYGRHANRDRLADRAIERLEDRDRKTVRKTTV